VDVHTAEPETRPTRCLLYCLNALTMIPRACTSRRMVRGSHGGGTGGLTAFGAAGAWDRPRGRRSSLGLSPGEERNCGGDAGGSQDVEQADARDVDRALIRVGGWIRAVGLQNPCVW
jgi:hypothetical protein